MWKLVIKYQGRIVYDKNIGQRWRTQGKKLSSFAIQLKK
jgi:hypothetical protein